MIPGARTVRSSRAVAGGRDPSKVLIPIHQGDLDSERRMREIATRYCRPSTRGRQQCHAERHCRRGVPPYAPPVHASVATDTYIVTV